MAVIGSVFYFFVGLVIIIGVLSLAFVYSVNIVAPIVVGVVSPGTSIGTIVYFWDAVYLSFAFVLWASIVEVSIKLMAKNKGE